MLRTDKVNKSQYKQCGVTQHFFIGQNLLKIMSRKDEYWRDQLKNFLIDKPTTNNKKIFHAFFFCLISEIIPKVINIQRYKHPPVISPSSLKQIFHPGYKPLSPDISPYIFITFFLILFITRWDFSSSDKNKRKLRRQRCVIYSHF